MSSSTSEGHKKIRTSVSFTIGDNMDDDLRDGRDQKRLYRSRREKMLSGVCGGIAEYFGLDPVLVRIIWVVLALASLGTAILIYLLLWLIVPERPGHI